MTEQTSYTFEDCIKKCESIIDGIYQDGYQSIHLYSLKTFIYGMVDIHNKTTIELQDEVNQFRAIGTIDEFKDLKEKNETLKALYENARKEGNNLIIKARAEAANEFANYLHEKAKENNGLRLSSETRSWTHPCIFDYLEEFKNEQICKEET